MADKRISQLVERVDIANNDVLPIVASGATTTNKVTISSIQDWMQDNLDVGVTSVGITLGSTGTDVNVTGSPITTSGNITINFPTASATNRGLLSAADWTTFNNKADAGNYVTLDTTQTITAQKTFTTSGSTDSVIISHGSGSGIALDITKGGNGEGIRVEKTSGSGNAVTITGGLLSAEDATFSSDIVVNGVNIGKGGGSITTNTRIGSSALSSNTTGSSNTAVGQASLENNIVGAFNTAIGFQALQDNTNSSNTAIGYLASSQNTSGSANFSGGARALENNTTGSVNTSIGFASLQTNTTGGGNVAIGEDAGRYISTATGNTNGGDSVFIGRQTKPLGDSQTNQIVIGYNAIGGGSNTVTIGNSSITDNYFSGQVHSTSFEIAASGTADPTIFRNTSGTTSSTTGSNVIGFNSVNNIFVTTESRGGFILGFNNSVSNREYTLPDASGTIALTSNLGGYVPYTGATSNVDLGSYILSANNLTANGGTNAGRLELKNANNASLIRTGYFVLSPSSNNTVIQFGFSTGASTWKNFGFSSHLLPDNTITLFSLPSGGGTLAVTSDLSGYLPLTGGTLTGALSGTSLNFSGDVQGTRLIAAASGESIILTPNSGGTTNRVESVGTLPLALVSAADITLAAGGTTPQITLANTGAVTLTGALNGTSAVFSGDVGIVKSSPLYYLQNSTSITTGVRGDLAWYNSSVSTVALIRASAITDNVGTSLDFFTRPASGSLTQVLTLASTGAATFSGSVGVGGSPTNRLTALASETGTQITTIPVAKFANTGNAFSKVVIGSDNANYDGVISMDNNATLANTKLRFYIGNGTGSTAGHSNDQIVLQGNGQVGIGTASPDQKLTIEASGGANGLISFKNSSSTTTSFVGVPNQNGFVISGATTDDLCFRNETGNMLFQTYGSERIRVTNNGLTFNGDTAAANALDDYEEGTWTPTLPNGGTLAVVNARYVKIGQKVTVSLYVNLVNPTNDSSQFRIGGLPFANTYSSPSLYYGGSFGYMGNGNLSTYLPITGSSFTYIYFHANNGTHITKTNANYITDAGANGDIIITITYFAAS